MTSRDRERAESAGRATSTGRSGFVAAHAQWTPAQRQAADELVTRSATPELVRVAYTDPHGLLRSKVLTGQTFAEVLRSGLDMSPGPFLFDTGHSLVHDIFAPGGSIGLPEIEGAGDFVAVPDPLTFRTLDSLAPGTAIVLCDEYLRDGTPHPLSTRAVLRRVVEGAHVDELHPVVGLELEWYLLRLLDPLDRGEVSGFGRQAAGPRVATVNGGYQFNADLLVAELVPYLRPLVRLLGDDLGLPVRSIEHESGPGQIELTFAPLEAMAAADAVVLARTLIKQATLANGMVASFMAQPPVAGSDPSGWHLHQSLADSVGHNMFASSGKLLSDIGASYVAGLLDHAAETCALAVPTVTGYRRMAKHNSLSPDRITWSHENRGALVRVLGGPADPGTHVENRIGDPAANPYLYIAAQLASGLSGVRQRRELPDAVLDPHDPALRPIPTDLGAAVEELRTSRFVTELLGERLMYCLAGLKDSEWARYSAWRTENPGDGSEVSEWESSEYLLMY